MISVSNGVVNTYSATELGYTASLYYDAQTVGTLYQERIAIAQGVTPILGGGAAGYLSAPAMNWNDYDLRLIITLWPFSFLVACMRIRSILVREGVMTPTAIAQLEVARELIGFKQRRSM